jgi:hypothetical protein
VTVTDTGAKEVDSLVLQLVSQRPAPYRTGHWPPPMEIARTGYATPEVQAAIQKLKQMGPRIFPSLVKHLGDDRYSYSGILGAWVNYKVGDAVLDILSDNHPMLGGYKSRKTASGDANYFTFKDYLTARGPADWSAWASGKSRQEIQLDFIDWCSRKEQERGFTDDAQRQQILRYYEQEHVRARKKYSEPDATANGSQSMLSETNRASSAAGSRR